MENLRGFVQIRGTICKEHLIEYLKKVVWKEAANGKHYASITGYVNGIPDEDGINGVISVFDTNTNFKDKTAPKMMLFRTKYVEEKIKAQRWEFKQQNPELENMIR